MWMEKKWLVLLGLGNNVQAQHRHFIKQWNYPVWHYNLDIFHCTSTKTIGHTTPKMHPMVNKLCISCALDNDMSI
jgi:hypothetical protein